jgi:glycosyltransferase involved in cell wall biosynthesis
MRAGLPVIASYVGGVPEAVIDGKTGFVVEANNMSTLRSRITNLLERPDERVRMGHNSRARYEKLFMFERMATETLAVYQDLLATED